MTITRNPPPGDFAEGGPLSSPSSLRCCITCYADEKRNGDNMSQRHGIKRVGYRPHSRAESSELPARSSISLDADLFAVLAGLLGSEQAAIHQVQEWAARCRDALENRRGEFVPGDSPPSVSRLVNRMILRRVIRDDLIPHLPG